MRRTVVILGLSVAAVACVAAGGRPNPAVRNQFELRSDELGSLGENASLYEVIARLRHRWLERRQVDPTMPEAADPIVVYAGTRPLGGIGELRSILARDVSWVHYYGPREAASFYGQGHSNGVILVELK